MKMHIILALALFESFSVSAQTFFNGGFELRAHADRPALWLTAPGEIRLDSLVKHSGRYSAHITSGESPQGNYAVAAITLPGHAVKNKTIEVRTKLRRDLADSTLAGLFMQKVSPVTPFPPQLGDSLAGKSDWESVSMSMAVDTTLTALAIGAIIVGSGTVWLDDVEVYADGERIDDYTPPQSALTEAEKQWLTDNTYHIYPKPDDRIGNFIGNARIVGIGEITHGSESIVQARIQIMKSLIEDKGFTIIAMESMTDMAFQSANRYISGDTTDTDKTARNTHGPGAMAEFTDWLAQYRRKTGRNVRYMGTENLNIYGPITEVDHLQNGELDEQLDTLRRIIIPVAERYRRDTPSLLKPIEFSREQREAVMGILTVCREWAPKNITDPLDLDLMMHNLDLIEWYLDLSDSKRDKIMADNIEWISRRYPEDKIIFLAHNDHVSKDSGALEVHAGYYLRQKFGEDYYSIGTCFYDGSYRARPSAYDGSTFKTYPAQPAHAGTYEYLFNSISKPNFFLPMRGVAINENNGWLAGPMEFRSIGAIHSDYGFRTFWLSKEFDAVMFIRTSTPVKY